MNESVVNKTKVLVVKTDWVRKAILTIANTSNSTNA